MPSMVCVFNLQKLANKTRNAAILASFVLIWAGCQSWKSTRSAATETTVQRSITCLEHSIEQRIASDQSVDSTVVSARYCTLSDTNDAIVRAINARNLHYLLEAITDANPYAEEWPKPQTTKDATEQFIRGYRASQAEGNTMPWDLWADLSYEGTWDSLVQFSNNIESYTGGAHPSRWSDFHLYNLRTGNEVRPHSCIKDTTALKAALLTKIRAYYNASAKPLSEVGLIEEFAEGIPIAQNISITSEGALFLYNNYEIAPYYMGPIELQLNAKEMASYFDLRKLRGS